MCGSTKVICVFFSSGDWKVQIGYIIRIISAELIQPFGHCASLRNACRPSVSVTAPFSSVGRERWPRRPCCPRETSCGTRFWENVINNYIYIKNKLSKLTGKHPPAVRPIGCSNQPSRFVRYADTVSDSGTFAEPNRDDWTEWSAQSRMRSFPMA